MIQYAKDILEYFPTGFTPRTQQTEILKKIQDALKKDQKYVLCAASTGSGKAQPLYSKLKTPTGWTTMGDIRVGDKLLASNGDIMNVTQLFPQGKKPIYEIVFCDDRKTECCEEHLWKVHTFNYSKRWKVVNTLELLRMSNQKLLQGKRWLKIHIPLIVPQKQKDIILPIDPYILGCLLGDGGFTQSITFTNIDEFIVNEFNRLLPQEFVLKKRNVKNYDFYIIQKIKTVKGAFRYILESLGLLGKGSSEKFIPEIYKNASVKQKIHLIQGLLDTDGYVGKNCGIDFTQTSFQLAKDMVEIVRSIGGISKIRRTHIPKCYYKNQIIEGQRAYSVSIRYKNPKELFRLPRKKERCSIDYQYSNLRLGIKSITLTNKFEECQCIMVDYPDHLYITDDYIVTHNSHIAATLANLVPDIPVDFKSLVDQYRITERAGKNDDYIHEKWVKSLDSFGCYVLTTTKTLQDQYNTLFEDSRILKGKRNYQCAVDSDFDFELAPCVTDSNILATCLAKNGCPYYNAQREALGEKFAVLSYSKFFQLPEFLRKRAIIICDEASELEDIIVSQFSATIEYTKLNREGINVTKLVDDNPDSARGWITDLIIRLEQMKKELYNQVFNAKKKRSHQVVNTIKLKYISRLCDSLVLINDNWQDAEFLIERDADKVSFVPLYVDKLSTHIFNWADHVILMSATIVDHKTFSRMLGIQKYSYIEAPSTFEPKKSPIYCPGKLPLNYANINKNLPKVIEQTLKICDFYKGKSGIIHTHTFKINNAIQKAVGLNRRFLFREAGISNERLLEEHIDRDDDTILVSPSLGYGIDLKGELGEFQIIIKLPYLPLGSKRIKILSERDSKWYNMKMLTNLIQQSGRCTRDQDDKSETYILDGAAFKTLKDNWGVLSEEFRMRLQ